MHVWGSVVYRKKQGWWSWRHMDVNSLLWPALQNWGWKHKSFHFSFVNWVQKANLLHLLCGLNDCMQSSGRGPGVVFGWIFYTNPPCLLRRQLWATKVKMQVTACSAGDVGLIPGLGRSSGEVNGNPLQCSWLGNRMDRGAWSPWGCKIGHNQVTKPKWKWISLRTENMPMKFTKFTKLNSV